VLKALPGAAIFRRDMLFNMPFVANWHKTREFRQQQTDRNTICDNTHMFYYDYVVGGQVLVPKIGILHTSESHFKGPWAIA